MSESRFEQLAESLGGSIARWPELERDGARALLQQSAAARACLARQAALDDWLDAAGTPPAPSDALRARILASAPRARSAGGLRASWAFLWQELGGARLAGPVFAASLVLGVMLAPLAREALSMDAAAAEFEWEWVDEQYEELVP